MMMAFMIRGSVITSRRLGKPGTQQLQKTATCHLKLSGISSKGLHTRPDIDSSQHVIRGEKVELPKKTLADIFRDLFTTKEGIGQKKAVIYQNNNTTFDELDNLSDCVARGIIGQIGPNSTGNGDIAFLVPPSDLRIFALMGVLKAYYGMMPLEPTLTTKRMEYMIERAKPKLLLTSKDCDHIIKDIKPFSPPVAYIEDLVKDSSNLDLSFYEHGLHRVTTLFTSGSTGLPKGTPLSTINILNRLMWGWSELPFQESDKVIHKSSIVFIDSLTEILGTLLAGVPLVVASQEEKYDLEALIKLMNEQLVTRVILVPTLLNSLLQWMTIIEEDYEKLPSLKTVITSGEKLPVDVARDFFTELPGKRRLVNLYGTTEVAGDVTYDIFEDTDDLNSRIIDNKTVSIGKPIWNTSLYIKKEDGNLASNGEKGELYIGGLSVYGRYLDSTDTSKFVANDISPSPDDPILFESGDNVMVHDGNLMYLGRTDSLIKIRGQRFDMSEVSHAVETVHGVKKSVTLSAGKSKLEIVCFYVAESDASPDVEVRMNEAWSEFLPYYVTPIPFCIKGDFPIGPTGKVNKQELIHLYRDTKN